MNKLTKMKTVIFLVVAVCVSTFFMSCSSDDDPTPNTIIGKWQLEQRFNDEVEVTLSNDCEKKSTIEFKADKTFIDMESIFDGPNGDDCVSSTDPGTWKYDGDNAIKMSYDGETEVSGVTFSFSDGNLNLVSTNNTRSIWKKIN